MYLIEMFLASLLLTIIIEFAVTWLFGLRTGKAILLVLLINVLTNPLAVMSSWLCGQYLPEMVSRGAGSLMIQRMIECMVVFGEALIYRSFRKELPQIRRPFLLSFSANAASWLCGVILNRLLQRM